MRMPRAAPLGLLAAVLLAAACGGAVGGTTVPAATPSATTTPTPAPTPTAVDGSASTPLHQVAASFQPAAALSRLGLATAYVAAGMASIFAFSFFLSTVTARPLVAVTGGVGLTILSRVLNHDYLPGVAVLSPYMPNNDVDLWLHLFQQPVQTAGMAHFLALQAVYAVVFGGLAWWWFARRDVLA